MEKMAVKEGILTLLDDNQGKTFEEIEEFLDANEAEGYCGEACESALRELLDEMRAEGFIEQRFMADGADTVDFMIEDEGREFLKGRGNVEAKWKTGRPSAEAKQLMQEKMDSMEEME